MPNSRQEFMDNVQKYIKDRVEETGEDPFDVLDEFKKLMAEFMDKNSDKAYKLSTNGKFISIVALEE